ncbi:hypothetical protein K437DRAFT_259527 [Tilletiaria anomala UBC 951]|uniref:Exocyst complex component EXO84 n=1 Tax=Tilletiaria anomala (strain ATCC 24038 / CBS 436.72 / UBC 951) TaxID=1037660 RepID=A0A066VH46_TILAU|nr:uncharacterized protein K437DRAFT_259527 [Tilletiaria anomala UBC 951]KDN38089.1 hypothetical protein K437DRAFT_259527 [Tilletiaria anomala UBC 951]
MSRSLRTRPQTLYQQNESVDDQGRLLAVSSTGGMPDAQYGAQNAAQRNISKSAARSSGNEGSNAPALAPSGPRSKVSSNLKKRLSMRYKDGADPLQGHIYRMATASDVPQVPSIPTTFLHHGKGGTPLAPHQEDMMNAAMSIPGFSLGQGHRFLPVVGATVEQGGVKVSTDPAPFGGPPSGALLVSSQRNFHPVDPQHVPGQFSRAHATSSAGGDAAGADLHFIGSERFDPQTYLRALAADNGPDTDGSVQQGRDALLKLKEHAKADLRRQVFANYGDFISISKEVAGLENDTLELKELLREWAALPASLDSNESLMQHSGGIGSVGALSAGFTSLSSAAVGSRLSARNSIQDLSQVYKAQIQALWENVEGSQRFVSHAPGRHLIAEAPNFIEMNSATYRPKQPVSLLLLDDLLLVATRKRKQMSTKVQLSADRCFNLGEIVVIDLKDASDLSNAIKIKRGKEVYVYRTERLEEKKSLLSSFRRVAEELAVKRRQQANESSNKIRDSLSGQDLDDQDPDNMQACEKRVFEWSDELAVSIALRQWEEAVSLVEKGNEMLAACAKGDLLHAQIGARLQQHATSLKAALCLALSSPVLKKASVVRFVSYMLRLDQGETARELFLNSRSELLKRRCRQIRFEGDVGLYISELALVHFTIVKNTSEWYMSAFKDNRMASGFIKWATAQIGLYADTFRKQVYDADHGADKDPRVVAEAVEISQRSASQLKEVGLDFGFLLE